MNLRLTQAYHPVTFAERGVWLPFTTPMLASTRIRHAHRGGTELIVPNPSGGRGVYIVHWAGACQLCQPTLYDTVLHQRTWRMTELTPAAIRIAARAVAAEGLAGGEARTSAAAAAKADASDLELTGFLLRLSLAEQVEPAGLPISAATPPTRALEHRIGQIIATIAGTLRRPADAVGRDFTRLAAAFAAGGVGTQTARFRQPRLLARLSAARESMLMWAAQNRNDRTASIAEAIATSVDQIISLTKLVLEDNRAMTADIVTLLRDWTADQKQMMERATRPDWLLDGWEQVCLLWESATRVPLQRAILLEIAQMVPNLPREATSWTGAAIDPDGISSICRVVSISDAWRTGSAAFSLIARNEHLRALST